LFTTDPTSTGSSMICPWAFDLMSTGLIGSTVPVAWTRTLMLPRVTPVVGSGDCSAFLFSQAASAATASATASRGKRRTDMGFGGEAIPGTSNLRAGGRIGTKRRPRTEAPPRSSIGGTRGKGEVLTGNGRRAAGDGRRSNGEEKDKRPMSYV